MCDLLYLYILMSDPSVVENGALMLRLQLAGMLCMGIVLISTCTFQSAGQAMGAFLLSVSRQGVVFAVVLMIALKVAGYYGVLASQAISDFLTAVLQCLLSLQQEAMIISTYLLTIKRLRQAEKLQPQYP